MATNVSVHRIWLPPVKASSFLQNQAQGSALQWVYVQAQCSSDRGSEVWLSGSWQQALDALHCVLVHCLGGPEMEAHILAPTGVWQYDGDGKLHDPQPWARMQRWFVHRDYKKLFPEGTLIRHEASGCWMPKELAQGLEKRQQEQDAAMVQQLKSDRQQGPLSSQAMDWEPTISISLPQAVDMELTDGGVGRVWVVVDTSVLMTSQIYNLERLKDSLKSAPLFDGSMELQVIMVVAHIVLQELDILKERGEQHKKVCARSALRLMKDSMNERPQFFFCQSPAEFEQAKAQYGVEGQHPSNDDLIGDCCRQYRDLYAQGAENETHKVVLLTDDNDFGLKYSSEPGIAVMTSKQFPYRAEQVYKHFFASPPSSVGSASAPQQVSSASTDLDSPGPQHFLARQQSASFLNQASASEQATTQQMAVDTPLSSPRQASHAHAAMGPPSVAEPTGASCEPHRQMPLDPASHLDHLSIKTSEDKPGRSEWHQKGFQALRLLESRLTPPVMRILQVDLGSVWNYNLKPKHPWSEGDVLRVICHPDNGIWEQLRGPKHQARDELQALQRQARNMDTHPPQTSAAIVDMLRDVEHVLNTFEGLIDSQTSEPTPSEQKDIDPYVTKAQAKGSLQRGLAETERMLAECIQAQRAASNSLTGTSVHLPSGGLSPSAYQLQLPSASSLQHNRSLSTGHQEQLRQPGRSFSLDTGPSGAERLGVRGLAGLGPSREAFSQSPQQQQYSHQGSMGSLGVQSGTGPSMQAHLAPVSLPQLSSGALGLNGHGGSPQHSSAALLQRLRAQQVAMAGAGHAGGAGMPPALALHLPAQSQPQLQGSQAAMAQLLQQAQQAHHSQAALLAAQRMERIPDLPPQWFAAVRSIKAATPHLAFSNTSFKGLLEQIGLLLILLFRSTQATLPGQDGQSQRILSETIAGVANKLRCALKLLNVKVWENKQSGLQPTSNIMQQVGELLQDIGVLSQSGSGAFMSPALLSDAWQLLGPQTTDGLDHMTKMLKLFDGVLEAASPQTAQ